MGEVFLKAVNLSIAASWIIVAVIVLRFLLKKAPKWIQCVLWSLVAIRLICPVLPQSKLSIVPSEAVFPVEKIYSTDEQTADNPHNWEINTGVARVDNGQGAILQDVSTGPVLRSNLEILGWVWCAGMGVMLLYAFITYAGLRKNVSASVSAGGNVMVCDDIESPFILGIVRPKIYIPSDMPRETYTQVLAHESAHLARKDHWWKPLGFLLLTVYWFNPLCWAAYILLCRDIELACDEKVIRDMDTADKAAYSQALLDCSVNRARVAACPLAFGEVGVKERVKSVLNYKKPAFWVIVCAVAACVVVAVCFLTSRKADEQDEQVTEEVKVEEEAGQELTAEESVDSGFISHLVDVSYDPNATNHMDKGAHYIFEIDNDGESRKPGYLIAEYEDLEGLDRSSEEAYCRSFAEKYAPELLPFYDSATKTAEDEVYIVEMVTDKCIVGLITYADCDFMRVKIEPLDAPFYDQLSELPGAVYVWEKEGFGSPFYITLNSDGTFQYYVGAFSSHIGMGRWHKDDTVLTLTEDEKQTGYGATFTFEIQDDNLIFVQKKSAAFGGVTVEDGDKFKRFKSSTEASGEESFRWAYPFYEWPLDEGETEKVLNACNFDITHDGKKDTIILTSIEPEAVGGVDRSPGDWGQVKVYDGTVTADDGSTPFWGLDWATAHTGNIQCFETTVDGLDYIVVTSLWVGQGFGDYMYDVLYWDNGAACVIDTKEYSFELDKEYDLTDFYDSLYNWINSKSVLIVASDCDIYPHVMYSSDGNTVNPDEFYSRRKKLYD